MFSHVRNLHQDKRDLRRDIFLSLALILMICDFDEDIPLVLSYTK